MTPAEHLAAAENLLASVTSIQWPPVVQDDLPAIAAAVAHAVIALAAETGVPHALTIPGGGSDAPVQAGS